MKKMLEVCLAEDKEEGRGEEQDLIVWEEVIKEWGDVQEFRTETDQTKKGTVLKIVRCKQKEKKMHQLRSVTY